ncbi:MAG: DUF3467 domain-containing protein [Myxococcota bacterium]|nr:DUF3467 domain-containing protein [Myxococcota bacterium]MDW8362333.1 DUF3467 domain-containing protein [Myxococcales bacterium]
MNPDDPSRRAAALPTINIKADDDVAKGRFANVAQVGSTFDVVVLDFAFVQGPQGFLVARVLLSPSHAKRFHAVLGETLARHEERFGPIDPGPLFQ